MSLLNPFSGSDNDRCDHHHWEDEGNWIHGDGAWDIQDSISGTQVIRRKKRYLCCHDGCSATKTRFEPFAKIDRRVLWQLHGEQYGGDESE